MAECHPVEIDNGMVSRFERRGNGMSNHAGSHGQAAAFLRRALHIAPRRMVDFAEGKRGKELLSVIFDFETWFLRLWPPLS